MSVAVVCRVSDYPAISVDETVFVMSVNRSDLRKDRLLWSWMSKVWYLDVIDWIVERIVMIMFVVSAHREMLKLVFRRR